jgi:hypothetical protein
VGNKQKNPDEQRGCPFVKGAPAGARINPSSQRDREEREKGKREDTRSYDPSHLPQMAAERSPMLDGGGGTTPPQLQPQSNLCVKHWEGEEEKV